MERNEALVGDGTLAVESGAFKDSELNFTFHRAFDEVRDWRSGLLAVKDLGFNGVLVSGKKDGKAYEQTDRLREMVEFSKDLDLGLDIIIGGSVRSINLQNLVKEVGADWYHSSAFVEDTGIASEAEIRKMKSILDNS
jgi:copper homeostasis protein